MRFPEPPTISQSGPSLPPLLLGLRNFPLKNFGKYHKIGECRFLSIKYRSMQQLGCLCAPFFKTAKNRCPKDSASSFDKYAKKWKITLIN